MQNRERQILGKANNHPDTQAQRVRETKHIQTHRFSHTNKDRHGDTACPRVCLCLFPSCLFVCALVSLTLGTTVFERVFACPSVFFYCLYVWNKCVCMCFCLSHSLYRCVSGCFLVPMSVFVCLCAWICGLVVVLSFSISFSVCMSKSACL